MQPAIRNRYNYDRRENSENNALYIDSTKEEENLTKQEFAEEGGHQYHPPTIQHHPIAGKRPHAHIRGLQ